MLLRLNTMLFVPMLICACGGSEATNVIPAPDFGQKPLASLTTPCEGIAGLTGQAILDVRVDTAMAAFAEYDVQGNATSTSRLQLDVTWPATPVATCYPPYQSNGTVVAQARVAIEGLTLKFQTSDGHFHETLAAKAWLPVLNGRPQLPQLIAVTTRDKIQGSWQPAPDYASANTVNFVLSLSSGPSGAAGNVGVSVAPPAELDAAIFRGSFVTALWPAS